MKVFLCKPLSRKQAADWEEDFKAFLLKGDDPKYTKNSENATLRKETT